MKKPIPAFFKELPEIETDRLILRSVKRSDLADMWEYLNDPTISEFTTWDYHKKIETTESYLNHVLNNYSNGFVENWGLELKSTHKLIGMVGFGEVNEEHRRGEIGYVLSTKFWNQGLMSEAIKMVISAGFETLNLDKILGRCISENQASKQILIKAGFSKEGHLRRQYIKNGIPRDIEVFGILKNEFQN